MAQAQKVIDWEFPVLDAIEEEDRQEPGLSTLKRELMSIG
jgi:hypothetical protein